MIFRTRSGVALHLEETGSGPVILCLHGVGGGTYFFDSLFKRLGSRYRLISLDLPGTNGTPVPPAVFSMDGWVGVLEELITDYIREPVFLLGHSMGTILALKTCAARPDLIRALILAGGIPEVIPRTRERLGLRAETLAQTRSMAGLGPKATPGIFSPKTVREQPELVARFEKKLEANDLDCYVRGIGILLGASATAALPNIHAPCLLISGSDDVYAPPDATAEFARQLPGAKRVIIPGCGHMPFMESPEAFDEAVTTFLDPL